MCFPRTTRPCAEKRTAYPSRLSWNTRRSAAVHGDYHQPGVLDTTPVACYAQVNDRGATQSILEQFLKPRFGNGVDLLIGAGRSKALAVVPDFLSRAEKQNYEILESPGALIQQKRAIAVVDGRFNSRLSCRKPLISSRRTKRAIS